MRPEGFPKRIRLRVRAEFLEVQGRGRKVHGEHLLALFLPTGAPRVGITASSRVGGSVVRNRLRRWVREHVRRAKESLPPGDVVIILKASAAETDHAAFERDLQRVLARAGTVR